MAYFDKIFIQKGEGVNVDITELDQTQYEAFLHMTTQLKKAYFKALKESGKDPINYSKDEDKDD